MKENEFDLSKYPKVLNTREDYEFIRNNFPRKYWEEDYKQLLNDSFAVIPYAPVKISRDENSGKINKLTRLEKSFNFEKIRKNKNRFEEYKSLCEKLEKEFDESILLMDNNTIAEGIEYEGEKIESNEEIRLFSDSLACVCHNIEKPDSKIRKLGYTPEQIFDYIIGISEEEFEKKQKEFLEKSNSKLNNILKEAGLSDEEIENENTENNSEDSNINTSND